MRETVPTTQFRRDAKRVEKRGRDLYELQEIVRHLAAGETLEPKHRDHKLTGPYQDFRKCHIRPDWLFLYRLTETELILVRTGTHADLFGE